MKLKNPTLAILAMACLIPNLAHAQATISTNIPATLSANLTIGDAGKIKATVIQTVTKPPASINFSYLAFNSQPFVMTTANSTGSTTVWRGSLSLLSNGTITGTALVESYSNNGTKLPNQTVTVDSINSRITSSTNNTTINCSNLRSESWGPYQDWNDYDVIAEYPVDVLIKFTNSFTARGKMIQNFKNTHNISQASEGDDYWSNEWFGYSLVITGPNGQIGTFSSNQD